jgi:hypothetical protein
MKIFRYISILFVGIITLMLSCKPEYDELSSAAAPDASQLSFTVTPVSGNQYKVKFANTSAVNGIISWNFGNGAKGVGPEATTDYNLKGTYTITMTLYTKGGSASVTKTYTQPIDNMALLLSDEVKLLIGAANDPAGKTWVIDNDAVGHFGLGPNALMDKDVKWTSIESNLASFEWYKAAVNEKVGWECYDDELTFIFNNNTFNVIFKNNGKSFGRKEGVATHAASYTNIEKTDDQYDRIFTYEAARNGLTSTWVPSVEGNRLYVTFGGANPIFPMYDINSSDSKFRIAYVDADHLAMIGLDGDDQNARLFILKRKGYIRPEPTFNINVAATANANEFAAKLTNLVVPAGVTINNVIYDFGDGSTPEESAIPTEIVNHIYQYKGNFEVKITVVANGKEFIKTAYADVTNNLPGYVPYLLNQMVLYTDFSETQLVALTSESGNVSSSIVRNPSIMYPNRSSNVMELIKTNNQYDGTRLTLPNGRRFNLTLQTKFRAWVYGKAGVQLYMNLINTDKGGDAWKTGTNDYGYTIKKSDTWELAEWDLSGISTNPYGGFNVPDVTKDPSYNQNFYNVLRLVVNNGNGDGAFTVLIDDLSGPHVEGLK